MNPWGTMNDWQRFEVDERVRHYGLLRRTERANRRHLEPSAATGFDPRTAPAMTRDNVAVCA